jgi:hypothetical protein
MSLFITDANRPAILARIAGQCTDEGSCLLWGGATGHDGAPIINVGGQCRRVRRVMWEALHGWLPPPGKLIVAKCRHPRCVSPDCLCCMSVRKLRRLDARRGAFSHPAANVARALAARRRATIPEAVVQQVRVFEGSCAQAAQATGVSLSHVKSIRAGRARKPLAGNVWAGLPTSPNPAPLPTTDEAYGLRAEKVYAARNIKKNSNGSLPSSISKGNSNLDQSLVTGLS